MSRSIHTTYSSYTKEKKTFYSDIELKRSNLRKLGNDIQIKRL